MNFFLIIVFLHQFSNSHFKYCKHLKLQLMYLNSGLYRQILKHWPSRSTALQRTEKGNTSWLQPLISDSSFIFNTRKVEILIFWVGRQPILSFLLNLVYPQLWVSAFLMFPALAYLQNVALISPDLQMTHFIWKIISKKWIYVTSYYEQ